MKHGQWLFSVKRERKREESYSSVFDLKIQNEQAAVRRERSATHNRDACQVNVQNEEEVRMGKCESVP